MADDMNDTNAPHDDDTVDAAQQAEFESSASFLASVYVDDEATIDQRALVETSPESLVEVGRFTDVRTVLTNTAPEASLSAREAHLAAALDVWSRMSDQERVGESTPSAGVDAAAAAALMTPASTSSGRRGSRRRTSTRSRGLGRSQWLVGAAASLVLIAGVGAVVRGVLVSQDDSTATQAVEAPKADADSEIDALGADEAVEVAGGNVGEELDPAVSDLSDVAAESGLFEDSASAASADTVDQLPAPPGDDPLIVIRDRDDLAVYGTLATRTARGDDDRNADIDFEAPFGSCEDELGIQKQLEPVIYGGVEVVVGVDLENRVVLAYTAADCAVVERVPLADANEQGPIVDTTSP